MTYNAQYFHEKFLIYKSFDFENSGIHNYYDVLLKEVESQSIYDYSEVDWKVFDFYCRKTYILFIAGTMGIKSRLVRLKFLLYILKHINDIFPNLKKKREEIERECVQYISRTLHFQNDDNLDNDETPEWLMEQYQHMWEDPNLFTSKLHIYNEENEAQKSTEAQGAQLSLQTIEQEEKPLESNLFRTDKIDLEICWRQLHEIITTASINRGKQKVLKQLISRAESLYFNPRCFSHKDLATELNKLQKKFVFTKADIDAAYKS